LNDIKNKKDHFEKYTDLFIPSQDEPDQVSKGSRECSKMIISHAFNLTLKYQTKVLNGRKRLRKIKQTLKIA